MSLKKKKKVGNRFVQAPSYLFSSNQVEEISKSLASKLNEILKNDDEKLESTDEPKVEMIEPKAEPKVEIIEQEVELKKIDEPKTEKVEPIETSLADYDLPQLPKKRRLSPKESTLSKIIKRLSDGSPLKGAYVDKGMLKVTNSYVLFVVKDFENELPKLKEFPNVDRLIPTREPDRLHFAEVRFIKEIQKLGKELKSELQDKMYKYIDGIKGVVFKVDDGLWVKIDYLVDAINVLEFGKDDKVTIEIYGKEKPIVIRKGEELALISPFRVKE